ncbi:MAG: hypothetical protein CVT80_14255 [Alphaproteobacteria bacterium HGW-Alphaproteobacteria-2]|nr:MAG: hypothetical protein CVT80_14255 [Alphaproteobacteria bacterium HGW-Alphaproteobacteria-2]
MPALVALACLQWLSFLGLCDAPDPAAEAAQAAEIIAAAEDAYIGSRFDIVEARLAAGALTVELVDLDACADGATIRSLTRFVDLGQHRVEGRVGAARPVGDTGEVRFFIRFHPAGDWARREPDLYAEKERLLDAARREVGWGQRAALLASERFLARHPQESLPAYTVVGYCPDGVSTSLQRDAIFFRTTDPERLTKAVSAVAARSSR